MLRRNPAAAKATDFGKTGFRNEDIWQRNDGLPLRGWVCQNGRAQSSRHKADGVASRLGYVLEIATG